MTGYQQLTREQRYQIYALQKAAHKLNPAGDAVVYATYSGGSDDDYITDIAADETVNAYVTGIAHSTDSPTTPGAFAFLLLPSPGRASAAQT